MKVTQLMVIERIKECGEAGCTVEELSEHFGIKKVSVHTHLSHIMKLESCPIYYKTEKAGKAVYYRYFFQTPVPEKEEPVENKNVEGYSDPTAAKAIKNLERYEGFMPGGIYEFKTRPGSLFLVIRTTPGTLLGYVVSKTVNDDTDDSTICWPRGDHYECVKPNQLTYAKFHWMNRVFDHRCPFTELQKVIAKSPFRAVEVPVVDEEEVKTRSEKMVEDTLEAWRKDISVALGICGPLPDIDYLISKIVVMRDEHCASAAAFDQLSKNAKETVDLANSLQETINKLIVLLGIQGDCEDEDILEAVKTLVERAAKPDSADATIYLLRREARIWKYAFDKVTGGTIAENLD